MLFKNHLFSLVLIGIVCASFEVQAQQQFTSLSKCREHFQTSVQTGSRDIAAMDAWCKGQMSELDFCAESALLNAMMTNSFSAAQLPQVRAGFENRCRSEIAARASGANNVAGTPSATNGSPGAAFDANGVPQPPNPPAQTNCAAIAAEKQPACTLALQNYQAQLRTYQSNLQAYQQRQEQARQQQLAAQQAQRQQQANNNMQAMQMTVGLGSQIAQQYAQNSGGGYGDIPVPEGYKINPPTAAAGPASVPTISKTAGNTTPGSTELVAANGPQPSPAALKAEAPAVKQVAPSASPQVDAVANAPSKPEDVPVPSGPETAAAQQKEQELQQIQQKQPTVISQLQATTPSLPFTGYLNATKSTDEAFAKYKKEKDLCVKEAERTNKLCVEGTSPGAKATKALIDYSGPLLGAMSSAMNACSSTKKVMNFAQMGMMVAKGVCVGSKLSCDSKCATAHKTLESLTKLIDAEKTALEQDKTTAMTNCSSLATPPLVAACNTDANNKYMQGQQYTNLIVTWTNSEKVPEKGTTARMIVSCQEKGKDIALMATNILTLAMAKMSAQKCEKDLATTGGGGGAANANAATTAEYCADPTTKGSDFCKCQTNPSAEGCPGALAAGPGAGNMADPKRGVALNLQKGPSGFAGGNGAGKPSGSGITVGGGGGGAGSGSAAVQLSDPKGLNTVNGAAMGGNAAAAGAAAGGSAQGSEAGAAPAAEDKKWSFGAFSSSSGGGVGGGRGSGGGYGNGNAQVSGEQQEAIERKLASDRFAAEVTTSTGPNNFDKIKQAVRLIGDTLDPNQ